MKSLLHPAMFRYVRYLPAEMVIGKVRHALVSRLLVPRASLATPPFDYDWEKVLSDKKLVAFAENFQVHGLRFSATCTSLHHGEFESNGVSHSFGDPSAVSWSDAILPLAEFSRWHHDLAFFYFAIPLIAADPRRGLATTASMIRSLDQQLLNDPSELGKFHWSPVAVASRTLALSTALILAPAPLRRLCKDDIAMVGNHLWRCTEILKLTVERYLGFNHAAITEMGLLIGLLLQGQATIAKKSSSKLLEALEDSTLTDGMWAERSPSYHIHMLVLADCLRAMTDPSSSEYLRIDVLTSLMRSALAAFVHPDGEIAIFNDAAIADAPEPSAVGWSACDSVETIVLPTAGFAKVVRAGTTVIMDAGPMGPDAVIGHGHADFLSVEVSVGGKRLIVDPGVAATSAGADREWTRSAESHNGPTLAGAQPAEFFGAWRVGRRGTAWFDQVTTDEFGATSITATCDGYTRWGVTVTRELIVERDGKLTINDRWAGNTHRDPLLSFLIYGIWTVHQATDQAVLLVHAGGDRVTMAVSGGKIAGVEQSRMFLKGPMNPESATCLRVRPDGQYVTTVLDPHHR